MTQDCVGRTTELLDSARSTADATERAGLLAEARAALADCLKTEADSAELNYLAGIVMYDSFCIDERYGEKAERYLLRTNELDPAHQFARLYLGHYYYDTEQYGRALDYFLSIDEQYFTAIEQQWRVLKLHELILCCRMFVGAPELTEHSFEALAEEYLAAPSEDVPVPSKLVDAFQKTATDSLWSRLDRGTVKEGIIRFIERLDFSEGFKLQLINDLSQTPHRQPS